MRNREPRLKKIRALDTQLPGLTRKAPTWKTYPPGQHGPKRSGGRRKISDYRVLLEEKQKVRIHYGVTERQLRTYFERAQRVAGATGEELMALMERRLDSVVFRLGFAPTIPAARQLVTHGHIQIDGTRVDRPGYQVNSGEIITVSERGRKIPQVMESVERGPEVRIPTFLALDGQNKFVGRVMGRPVRDDVPFIVRDLAIVEFYAR